MCGGFIEIQSRRAALRFHEEMKQNMPLHAAPEGLISCACSPRGHQAEPAGLAIVAALEAELVQSGAATSRTKAAESPPSATSSLPIPISSSGAACEDDNYTKYDFPVYSHKQSDFNHTLQNKKSIFSTSLSPPSGTYNYIMSSNLYRELSCDDFLGTCFSCKRPLAPSKDIYMYRGDRAFCSTDCRYKHIVADESLSHTIQVNQQCVQASSPTKNPPPIAIAILV